MLLATGPSLRYPGNLGSAIADCSTNADTQTLAGPHLGGMPFRLQDFRPASSGPRAYPCGFAPGPKLLSYTARTDLRPEELRTSHEYLLPCGWTSSQPSGIGHYCPIFLIPILKPSLLDPSFAGREANAGDLSFFGSCEPVIRLTGSWLLVET